MIDHSDALVRWFKQLEQSPMNPPIRTLRQLRLPSELERAILSALRGETDPINTLLFRPVEDVGRAALLAWLAPVAQGDSYFYAWMVGTHAASAADVSARFAEAVDGSRTDRRLHCTHLPPPLLFVEPTALSSFTSLGGSITRARDVDDFEIFQTGHAPGSVPQINDLAQRMVLNARLLRKGAARASRRAEKLFRFSGDCSPLALLDERTEWCSLLHAEGHNRGHFAGPWPFDDTKQCLMYEAIEEFRACLCAVRWGLHLGLSYAEQTALACSAALSRFLYYGLRAMRTPKTRQAIREITVGLLFFETLRRHGVISGDTPGAFMFNLDALVPALHQTLADLHAEEASEHSRGEEGLRSIARRWYAIAYPSAELSSAASALYAAAS